MALARRAVAAIGGLRVIAALGGALLVLGMATPVAVAGQETAVATVLILFALVVGPALVILFGALRLPRSDVDPAFYPTVAQWTGGGVVAIALILGLYDLQPGGGIVNPMRAVPPLLAVAAAAGFAGGVHDARARTRQRELDRRNEELDGRNRELDERNEELDERNGELDERNRELRQTRAELQRTVDRLQASNERLEQFAYAVSHDLQEPLRTISSQLQLLERRYDEQLDDDAREFVELSVDAAGRMHAMVEGLLAYSRVETEAQTLEPVDLNEVLADVRADLGQRIEETDADVTVAELPTVEGDRNQLRQVFQNLLDNAIEYSGEGTPRIHVSAEPPEGAERARTGADAVDYWTIAVRDEGIGMEPEETGRIFEVFERLHGPGEYEGTGVGLAICKRIVERHGGDIWADSAPGEGATFFLTLPSGDADGVDDATADRWARDEQSAADESPDADASPATDDASAEDEPPRADDGQTENPRHSAPGGGR